MIWVLALIMSWEIYALEPQELVRSVLDHYPLIESSLQKKEAAEGAVTAAKGEFDHKLKFKADIWRQSPYNNEYYETRLERQTLFLGASLFAGHRQGAGDFNYYALDKDTSTAGQLFLGIAMPLLRNLMTDEFRTNLRIKNLEKQLADQELRIKKLTAVHEALSTYYKWLLQLKKVSITRQMLDLAYERKSMYDKKYRAGDVERLKVVDNQRQIDKRSASLYEYEIELRKISAKLALFNRDKDGNPVLPEAPTEPEKILSQIDNRYTQHATARNPQVQAISVQKEINEAQEKLGKQSRLPGLNVSVAGGQELSNRPGYGQHILQVGVNFDFPLENRKAEGKTVEYYYKKKATELQLTYMNQELKQLTDFSHEASRKSLERWKVTHSEYENSAKIAIGERRRLLQGGSDLFVVNLREQDQADVDMRRWAALYDYHQFNLDAGLYSASLPVE